MTTLLLLGANGQLGTDIQTVFSKDNDIRIIPITRKELDVECAESVGNVLGRFKEADFIINCTSYHKTDEVEDFPQKAFSINAIAVREMAKYCNQIGKTFIHFSTDYVFDGEKTSPYCEQDLPAPLNVYGISKVAGEHFIQAYHDKCFIFRVSSLFGVAGASGKGGNFVETMIRLAKEGKSLRVVNDQIMSPTHTLDIAHAIRVFIREQVTDYGTYHCSGEGECSWFEFAAEIFRQTGVSVDLTPVSSFEYKTKAIRPKYSVLSNEKLKRYVRMNYWKDSLNEYLRLKGHISK